MNKIQTIYCPNCGKSATETIVDNSIRRIACESCDYLMVQCSKTGRVIEAYAPGIYPTVDFGKRDARNCPQAALASNPRE